MAETLSPEAPALRTGSLLAVRDLNAWYDESHVLQGMAFDVREGEVVTERTVRFRTVGDLTLTGCIESTASTVAEIMDEISVARLTERGATRGDDRFSEAAMEDRKKEGYF